MSLLYACLRCQRCSLLRCSASKGFTTGSQRQNPSEAGDSPCCTKMKTWRWYSSHQESTALRGRALGRTGETQPSATRCRSSWQLRTLEAPTTATSQPCRLLCLHPVPAHRLDARVGGVLAVAKSRRALSGFSRLFKERRVTKRYSAVVVGKVCLEDLDSDESSGGDKGRGGGGGSGTSSRGSDSVGGAFGQFRYSLVRSGDASGEASVASGEANGDADGEAGGEAGGGASEDCAILRLEQIDAEGRVSRTEIRVVDVTPCSVHGALTTLDLRPISGRRHQLRIACAVGLGTPIVGDDLYHDEAQAVRRARQLPALPPVRRKAGLFLQAVEISPPHPITGDELRAHAPEMGRFDKLRERAASGAGYSEAGGGLARGVIHSQNGTYVFSSVQM